MRILHIISQKPDYTGSGTFVKSLINEGIKSGMTQAIVYGISIKDKRKSYFSNKVKEYYLEFENHPLNFKIPGMSDEMPYNSSKFSALSKLELFNYESEIRLLLNLVKGEFQPDIIWTNHLWIISNLACEIFSNIPVLIFAHGSDLLQAENSFNSQITNKLIFKNVKRIYALNDFQKHTIVRIFKISPYQIEISPGCINKEIFYFSTNERSDSNFELVFVGKISFMKGFPFLLEAVENLLKSGYTNIRLSIIGGKGDTENRIKLKSSDNIRYLSILSQEEIAKVFRTSHVLILPSFYEGFGLVVFEALASGCRVVMTKIPGVYEYISDNTGIAQLVEFIDLPTIPEGNNFEFSKFQNFIKDIQSAILRTKSIIIQNPEIEEDMLEGFISELTWEKKFNKILEYSQELTI